jgi:hypothetical protein
MNGDVSGGDTISSYTGTYVQDGDRFTATIAVKRHTQGARQYRRCQKSVGDMESIVGIRRLIKSANFADLVSGLKRLRSALRAMSRPIAARCINQALTSAARGGVAAAMSLIGQKPLTICGHVVWDLLLQGV